MGLRLIFLGLVLSVGHGIIFHAALVELLIRLFIALHLRAALGGVVGGVFGAGG